METAIVHLIGPMTSKLENDSYWSKNQSISQEEQSKSLNEEKRLEGLALFVDGGWQHYQALQSRFTKLNVTDSRQAHWVGDGDSLKSTEQDPHFLESDKAWKEVSKTKLSPDKSKSDLLAALHWLNNHHGLNSLKKVIGHGLLGGRLDHQLAVLGDLTQWLSEISEQIKGTPTPTIHLLDDEGRDSVTIFFGNLTAHHKGTFSVFSLRSTSVSLKGEAEYIGDNIELRPHSSKGLSNVGKGTFSIESKVVPLKEMGEAPLILIKNFD